MQDLLLDRLRRGVSVTVKVDLDGRTGEDEIFDELAKRGCRAVASPSCASRSGARYFASSHEKVAVIDGVWTLVQSGNWTPASVPRNVKDGGAAKDWKPGNRDSGVAIRDRALARFFDGLLEKDIGLETAVGRVPEGVRAVEPVLLTEAAPATRPSRLFPSRTFQPRQAVRVTPVVSPENYMDVMEGAIRDATDEILVEQQYIRGSQPQVIRLLDAITAARKRHRGLIVRILVAMPKPFSSYEREVAAIRQLGKDFNLLLGGNVRILDTKRFVHCHNKLVVIDRAQVLVSSQNWSDSALALNREAGLFIEYVPIARYYGDVIDSDWATGLRALPARRPSPRLFAPQALATGRVVELDWGDYAEV